MKDLQFPVGISNFEKIREGGYYYIDKTNLISELLSGGIAEVTLITRPRRFGKSLGMSTLANFLDIRKDSKQLFEGLAISKNTELCKKYNCEFDDRGNIGKRYRRLDEIGTPFCVTYDFESETDGCVTVRDRDTMEQERVAIADLDAYFEKKFEF